MSYLKMVAVYSTNKFVIIRLLSIQIEKEMTSVTERAHETGDRSSRNNCRFNEIQHFAINTRTNTPAALLETKFNQQWADGKKIKFVSRLAFICCPSFCFLINLFDSIRLIVHFFSLAANYALAHTHTHTNSSNEKGEQSIEITWIALFSALPLLALSKLLHSGFHQGIHLNQIWLQLSVCAVCQFLSFMFSSFYSYFDISSVRQEISVKLYSREKSE